MTNPLEKVISELASRIASKGTVGRRCLECIYWIPETESSGKCIKGKEPFYKHPNYVCKNFKHWKLKNEKIKS